MQCRYFANIHTRHCKIKVTDFYGCGIWKNTSFNKQKPLRNRLQNTGCLQFFSFHHFNLWNFVGCLLQWRRFRDCSLLLPSSPTCTPLEISQLAIEKWTLLNFKNEGSPCSISPTATDFDRN